MLISVCVASYKRPEGLNRLLTGLNQLTFKKCETPEIEVIIVDNDVTGSASKVCTSQLLKFKWKMKYSIEPQRGISYAINKAITCVNKDANFIAFIDDDEVPHQFWLDEILSVQQTHNADVVTGPALPHFIKSDVPNSVVQGKFFDPQRYPTGHQLKVAFTNNVLISSSILHNIDKIFDERFALSGGEDSHFFMRLYRAGYKLVWADQALVYEWIPESRTNIKWILQRGYLSFSKLLMQRLKLQQFANK